MDVKNWLEETIRDLNREKSGILLTDQDLAELAAMGQKEYDMRLAWLFASFLDRMDIHNLSKPYEIERHSPDWIRCLQIFQEAERKYPTGSMPTRRKIVEKYGREEAKP